MILERQCWHYSSTATRGREHCLLQAPRSCDLDTQRCFGEKLQSWCVSGRHPRVSVSQPRECSTRIYKRNVPFNFKSRISFLPTGSRAPILAPHLAPSSVSLEPRHLLCQYTSSSQPCWAAANTPAKHVHLNRRPWRQATPLLVH